MKFPHLIQKGRRASFASAATFVILYTTSMSTNIAGGTVHPLPKDWREALLKDAKAHATWDDITPLARNEWICWVTSGKKQDTRDIRIAKGLYKMKGGMRRPCCWPGCPHR